MNSPPPLNTPITSYGERLTCTTLPNGSLSSPNSRFFISSLITSTRAPLMSSASVKLRPSLMSPPLVSSQLAVVALTRADGSIRSKYLNEAPAPLPMLTPSMLSSRAIACASVTRIGGLLRHLQVSSVSSQASRLIGNRFTKKVVGPAFSNSAATPRLIPWIAADITTTTSTPIAMPRMVSAARTRLARSESTAMTTPSNNPEMRAAMDIGYSCRSAATGSRRAARLAG